MSNFVFCLLANLGILAGTIVVFRVAALWRRTRLPAGSTVFIVLMALACAFDATLSLFVFADAGSHWEAHELEAHFFERLGAYALSAALALALPLGNAVRARRARRQQAGDVVIETSPCTRSTLPM